MHPELEKKAKVMTVDKQTLKIEIPDDVMAGPLTPKSSINIAELFKFLSSKENPPEANGIDLDDENTPTETG